jgi:hypothetical protein
MRMVLNGTASTSLTKQANDLQTAWQSPQRSIQRARREDASL